VTSCRSLELRNFCFLEWRNWSGSLHVRQVLRLVSQDLSTIGYRGAVQRAVSFICPVWVILIQLSDFDSTEWFWFSWVILIHLIICLSWLNWFSYLILTCLNDFDSAGWFRIKITQLIQQSDLWLNWMQYNTIFVYFMEWYYLNNGSQTQIALRTTFILLYTPPASLSEGVFSNKRRLDWLIDWWGLAE